MKLFIFTFTFIFLLFIETIGQDNVKYYAKYNLTFVTDTSQPLKTKKDVMWIEVHKNFSLYYSYYRQKGYQQILLDMKSNNPIATALKNRQLYNGWAGPQIIRYNFDAPKNFAIIDGGLGSRFYKTLDSLGIPQWLILKDTLSILEFPCQKAIATFRGRTYTAWFTAKIPSQTGPYKFVGLPGLILKINDSKNNFVWECFEITKELKEPPFFNFYKDTEDISYKELRTLKKLKFTDPIAFDRLMWGDISATNGNGEKLSSPQSVVKSNLYNPIELTEK